jgi:ParB/RepB/Spo0J family partition protein
MIMPLRYEKKPLAWFKTTKQVREVDNDPELRSLGESLRIKQLQAVVARTDGTLIFGHRRLAAAKTVGLDTLEVVVADDELTETQVKLFQLAENVHRANLTGYQKWTACAELMCMNPQWQMKDLAEHLHLDGSTVTRVLSPSKCIEAWQDALKQSKVGIGDCYAASKVPASDQAALLALKLAGASRDAVEEAGRKSRNGNTPTVKLSRIKCQLPSGVVIVVSGRTLSLDELIEALGEAQKEAKKARDQNLDAKTFQAVMKDKANAAGV